MLYVLGVVSFFGVSSAAEAPLKPDAADKNHERSSLLVKELKTEHLIEPLGIDTPRPRFRWLLESDERGQLQAAYQIQVASSLERLQSGQADRWDSGKVTSDNSVEVLYDGSDLASGERDYWRVRVWDRHGNATAYSDPSFFEMGLRKASDWQGQWIAAKQGISSPLFRREFTVDAPVRRARVYISGLGYYELSINGRKIGDRVLDPASTYYHNDKPFKLGSRVLYATYDVTSALQSGANAVGVMLGHGWYSGERDAPVRTLYGDRPRLMFQLNVELTDGHRFTVVSDEGWKTSAGPITYNDLANGETYDARLEQRGWDIPGFNESSWERVSRVQAPSGALTAETLPEKVIETRPAVRILAPKEPAGFENAYVYDFGQNFSGWVRIAVSGPRDAQIALRYGADLYVEDDTLDARSGGAAGYFNARQGDAYTLKGEGMEVWEPRFTLHGFRYVEVRGFSDRPIPKVEGRFVRSAVDSTGTFSSSNELLNQIHHNIQWTFMSSLQGIPHDAADRAERFSWLGDPGFVAEDYIQNYDMVGFWEKWLDDIQDSQKENGDVPLIAPLHERVYDHYEKWTAWQSTYPLLVWYLYQYYGDQAVVQKHFAGLKKLVDYMGATATDHIVSLGLGDHMEPQEDGYSSEMSMHTPAAVTSTAYYYYSAALVARMADVLGQSADARRYTVLAQAIKQAFNRRFFNPDTHQYATGSQAANALAIYLDLAPPDQVPAVLRNLTDDIAYKHNYHVSTGIIGSNAVVQTLPEHGEGALMYRLATQTAYPSLGYQVTKGATTLCETYECGAWLSKNMKMFGSLDKFFYRDLAGIRVTRAGYRKVLIKPQPVGDLRTVTASQQTVRGPVAVDWVKGNGYFADWQAGQRSFALNVSIPAGMQADIAVPTLGWVNVHVTESGNPVWTSNAYVPGTPGLTSAQADGDAITFHTGSGSYHFVLNGAAF